MDLIDWLLESDPAIRWQVLRDITDAAPDEVAAERARVEREGQGGRVQFAIEGKVGQPSRWNTLRALRVLDWWKG